MSDWGGGYITDIPYITGWYRQQTPAIMAIACLLGGVQSPMPAADDPVSYVELGCGHGLGAMLLAASNPAWRITAIDFNPAHIATARAWAAEAGLTNVSFLEADLATLAGDAAAAAVPMADFVSMHGVWSWVPPPVRAGIVNLLRAKVQPGGVVHLSYNALPGWGSALGMQRLLRGVGRARASRSDRQAEEGFKFVRELFGTDALQLQRSPIARELMEKLSELPTTYLAHEYMNEAWAPCFMADVAGALADAKLEWVGSANLIENFPELTLTTEQRALAQQFDDPLLRELIKDHCIERPLRHDVFIRGARRIGPHQRNAALEDVWIGLNVRPEDVPMQADMPAGKAALNPEFYLPIARAMANGPRRVGDLMRLPQTDGKRDNAAEVVGIMVGSSMADVALRPDAPVAAAAQRFNAVTARHLLPREPVNRPVAAATVRMGMPAPASVLDLVILERTMAGEGNVDDLVRYFDGPIRITNEPKFREVLAEAIEGRLPLLRAAGVL